MLLTLLTLFALLAWDKTGVETVILPIHLDDPELYEEYTPTPGYNEEWRWNKETSQAQHTGYLFAGRTEFPWIVDIRNTDLDQEQWSTGNLITSFHVLTSCRSVGYWHFHVPANDLAMRTNEEIYGTAPKDPNETPWWHLSFVYYVGLKVSFAPIYLWEDYKYRPGNRYDPFVGDVDAKNQVRRVSAESGSRNVIHSYRHMWCDQETVEFDIGILTVQKPIYPVENTINLMPPILDLTNLTIPKVNLSHMNQQRRVCYVASWGRSFFNWPHHMVLDYKVKYRVYFKDLYSECGRQEQTIHFQRVHERKPVRLYSDSYMSSRLWCFKTYQRIGSVCDHDRGAPLVCDGKVYGIVVRGARYERCSNLFGQPFMVMRLSEMNEYWQLITTNIFDPKFALSNFSDQGDQKLFQKKPGGLALAITSFNPSLPLVFASQLTGLYAICFRVSQS